MPARQTLVLLGAIVWVIVPLLALGLIGYQNQHASFVARKPAWVPVVRASEIVRSNVDIALLWTTPDELVAPAWNGLVQQVAVKSGQSVASGDVVAVIDGISRIAWHTPGVLYRPVAMGSLGDDVGWVKAILSAHGYPQTNSSSFDKASLAGARAFARSIGVPGASSIAAFDPGWIVYLPSSPTVLVTVDMKVAVPAPAPGTPLASGDPHIAQAALVKAGVASGAASSPQDTGATAPGLTQAQFADAVRKDGVVAQADDTLESAGTPIELDSTRSSLSPTAISNIEHSIAPNTISVVAQLLRKTGPDQFTVPAAAIASNPSLSMCVRRGSHVAIVDIHVETSGDAGTIVSGDLALGDYVRVPATSGDAPCRSTSSD